MGDFDWKEVTNIHKAVSHIVIYIAKMHDNVEVNIDVARMKLVCIAINLFVAHELHIVKSTHLLFVMWCRYQWNIFGQNLHKTYFESWVLTAMCV